MTVKELLEWRNRFSQAKTLTEEDRVIANFKEYFNRHDLKEREMLEILGSNALDRILQLLLG